MIDGPYLARLAALAVAYFLAGLLGLSISVYEGHIALMWPASGIGLAGLLKYGQRMWPGITLGALGALLASGTPWATSLGAALGYTLEGVTGAYLLNRAIGFHTNLDRFRDAVGLVLLAAGIATLVGAFAGSVGTALSGAVAPVSRGTALLTWWMGDMMGVLAVTPIVLARFSPLHAKTELSESQIVEAMTLLVTLSFVSVMIFGGRVPVNVPPLFAFFPFVIYAALRFSLIGATAAFTIIFAFGAYYTAIGVGPFAGGKQAGDLALWWGFDGILAVTGLFLAVAEIERAVSEQKLRASESRYRGVVEDQTEFVCRFLPDATLTFVNNSCCNFFGKTRQELLGESFLSLAFEEDREWLKIELQGCSAQTPVHRYTHRMKSRAGTVHWLRWVTLGIFDERGRLIEFQAVGRDISQAVATEEALRESEDHYRMLAEYATDLITRHAPDGKYTYVSPASSTLFGYEPAETMSRGPYELVHPEDAELLSAAHRKALAQSDTAKVSYRLRHKDGNYVWLETSCKAARGPGDEVREIVCVTRDISMRKFLELEQEVDTRTLEKIAAGNLLPAALDALAKNIEALCHGALCAIYLLDDTSRNLRLAAAPSFPAEYAALIETIPVDTAVNFDGGSVYFGETIAHSDYATGQLWENYREAALRFGVKACWSQPIVSAQGRIAGSFALHYREPRQPIEAELNVIRKAAHLAGIAIDRSAAESRLHFLANHDALTRLPNRTLFSERLDHALSVARRNRQSAAVLLLDLDRFKLINDTLGHEAGDKLLTLVAERIRGCLRSSDTIARLGGDDFTMMMEAMHGVRPAAVTARKVLDAVAAPFRLDGKELVLGANVGISCYPGDGENTQALIKNAELAMQRARAQGPNGYRFFSEEMNARAARQMELEGNLRNALANNDLALYYQPVLDLASGRITGMEGLLRWNHPQRGALLPEEFIPAAEEAGLLVSIGDWILRAACGQARKWQETGHADLRIAVNLSLRQLRKQDLAARVAAALQDSGLDARFLELEVTEPMLMENFADAERSLRRLRDMGLALIIDDFGTGYSSLGRLKQLPVQGLKIDRSFVKNIPQNGDDCAVTAAVIALAKKLDLRVIAEGPERDEQVEYLRAQGCTEIQGNVFCAPLPADEMTWFLRGKNAA